MEDVNLNPSEGASEVVDTQEIVQDISVESSQVADVKPVQGYETNAAFAEMRRQKEAAEAKATQIERDYTYGTKYSDLGVRNESELKAKYGHEGINTWEDVDKYYANQEFQQQYGIDPKVIDDRVKTLLEEHPAVKIAKEQSNSMIRNNAAIELAKVAKSLGINDDIKSWEDVEKLPKWEAIKQGILTNNLDIVQAARLAYFEEAFNSKVQATEQETVKKLIANEQSSPGSLGSSGEVDQASIYSLGKTDFNSIVNQVLRGERKKL